MMLTWASLRLSSNHLNASQPPSNAGRKHRCREFFETSVNSISPRVVLSVSQSFFARLLSRTAWSTFHLISRDVMSKLDMSVVEAVAN